MQITSVPTTSLGRQQAGKCFGASHALLVAAHTHTIPTRSLLPFLRSDLAGSAACYCCVMMAKFIVTPPEAAMASSATATHKCHSVALSPLVCCRLATCLRFQSSHVMLVVLSSCFCLVAATADAAIVIVADVARQPPGSQPTSIVVDTPVEHCYWITSINLAMG